MNEVGELVIGRFSREMAIKMKSQILAAMKILAITGGETSNKM